MCEISPVLQSLHERFNQRTFVLMSRYALPRQKQVQLPLGFRGVRRRILFWAYNTYYGDPWNDFDVGGVDSPDAAVAYPGVLGPIPARNWDAFGRGVEDYQMVRLLENWLAKAGTSTRGEQARATQTELKRRIADAALNDKNPARFEEHRAWVKAQILQWRPAGGSRRAAR